MIFLGPIVRVTPDEVHIRDPEWSHVLYAGAGHIRDKDSSLAHAAGTADGCKHITVPYHTPSTSMLINFYSIWLCQA